MHDPLLTPQHMKCNISCRDKGAPALHTYEGIAVQRTQSRCSHQDQHTDGPLNHVPASESHCWPAWPCHSQVLLNPQKVSGPTPSGPEAKADHREPVRPTGQWRSRLAALVQAQEDIWCV